MDLELFLTTLLVIKPVLILLFGGAVLFVAMPLANQAANPLIKIVDPRGGYIASLRSCSQVYAVLGIVGIAYCIIAGEFLFGWIAFVITVVSGGVSLILSLDCKEKEG